MSVGMQLRQAREARKLSMADVTAAIKIQPWVLEALEGDRLQEQMSPIYAKGFLASYARFLHLVPEPLIAQIPWSGAPTAETTEVEAPAAVQPSEIPSVVTWRLPSIPWAQLRRLGAVAAIVGLVVVNPLRWLPKIQLPVAKHQAVATKPSTKRVAKAAPVAVPQPEPKPLRLASVAPVVESVPLPPPQLAPAPVAKVEPLELAVTATRATWIRVRADGKLLAQQRLERGAKELWVGKKSIEVVVAKPSQVEVSLNGKSITSAAIQYDVRLLITHQGVSHLPSDAQ